MRRVVVTPTFAVGLGVVVAAVLAYPMQTVFNYAAPNAVPCPETSCGGMNTQDGGEPASVPGNRLSTPGPSATHAATKRPGSAARTGRPGGAGGHTTAAQPELSYQTSGKWHWGFDGTILIKFRPRLAHGNWRLRFGYPSAHILTVWGAGRHLPHGTHSVAVAPRDWPGQDSSGRLLRISIEVAGPPGPPHWCLFNGRPCHVSQRPGDQQGSGGGGTGHEGGSGTGHEGPGGGGTGHKRAADGGSAGQGGGGSARDGSGR